MSNQTSREIVQFIDVPMHLLEGTPAEIISYLKDAHKRYRDVDIPHIEQQFIGLMKLYPNALTLGVIFNLFQKFQMEMQLHMKQEEKVLYPQILAGKIDENKHEVSHEDQEPLLTEIIHLLSGARYMKHSFGGILLRSLERFESELRLHGWVEEHLLLLK
jgi:iron-sulfur cluster repair protein YtfE (RIC family)